MGNASVTHTHSDAIHDKYKYSRQIQYVSISLKRIEKERIGNTLTPINQIIAIILLHRASSFVCALCHFPFQVEPWSPINGGKEDTPSRACLRVRD
jgi:hypothetical protein